MLKAHDRICGCPIQHGEYINLEKMMENIGLFEHESKGSYYSWSNNHREGTIYSRINRVICNKEWYLQFPYCEVDVLNNHISDHALLKVIVRNLRVAPTK